MRAPAGAERGQYRHAGDGARGATQSAPACGRRRPETERGSAAHPGLGLRHLQDRPPHRRRGAAKPALPLIPGHQVVARDVDSGERVGVPWLGWSCGTCRYCLRGRENLCDRARFTGYDLDGGFAELAVADEQFCLPIPEGYPDLQAAPLLCAGLIRIPRASRSGRRANPRALRIWSGRIVARGRSSRGNASSPSRGGATPPRRPSLTSSAPSGRAPRTSGRELDAASSSARGRARSPRAGGRLERGAVVCAGIHMSDIPAFPYGSSGASASSARSRISRVETARISSRLRRASRFAQVETYRLEDARTRLERLRAGDVRGAAVIDVARDQDAECLRAYISRRPASARPSVTSSACAQGRRRPGAARRGGSRGRPRSRSARYAAVASPVVSGSLRGRPRRCRFARRGGGARRSEGARLDAVLAATARRRGRGRGRDARVRSTERSAGCSTTQTSEWSRRASRQIEHVSSSVRLPRRRRSAPAP